MVNRYVSLTSVVGAVLLLLPVAAHGCAVCWVGASSPDDPMSHAFNWSILFLMAMPYAIVGSIAGWLIYTYWRASTRQRKESPVQRLAWTQKEKGA